MSATGMTTNGSRVSSMRIYRQSVCYPKANIELLFDVIIERLASEEPDEYRLLYSCGDFFIDGHAPESFIDKLSISVSLAFYPLDLSINRKNGTIQINNSQEIIERWETKKKELLQENAGEYLLTYISQMDTILRDVNAMQSAIEKNFIFINLFVIPLSIDSPVYCLKMSQLHIPSGQYGERLLFNGKFMLEEEENEDSTLLSFDGRAARYSITSDGSPHKDNFRAKVSYFISSEMKTIDDIYADTYLLSEDEGGKESLFQSIRIHYLRN
ncbi:hypothetical protein [Porphyromonas crevioricanis]|nr:hypothetical protein [Porphyromonas crevioricanis]